MTNFGFNTTTDEVLRGIDLTGTLALVTGASSGLGVETARALVAHGAEVIGAVRNLAKADAATASVREAAESGGGRLELVEVDLANLVSVRTCADLLIATGRSLDLVIANAGVMATPYGLTKDGFETQFGTNVLGHFVLANRLAPLMRAGGRLVMLSSAAHGIADVDLEDPNFERADYERWTAYGRSKTGDALIAVEFDRRHRDRGIRAAAVHPGGIRTELQRHYSREEDEALVASINRTNAAAGLPPFQWKTVEQGAATTLWAAAVADADMIGGQYCEDCHVAPVSDGEGIAGGVRPYAVDPKRAQALWEKAEELVGERF
ncbi:SDR family NAD(P)-dependent oxidoreductase [Sphingomonas phyllosphaerae]|uniref:SDR family NAD(P)-dependent oxidoreductase n=1 Tax=Sphingomonas phyllosphaerae TaxID=257003 RepID=UPI0024133A91|nr:SDR family NAD(P)-dependent oxidoreductase [Sphingomonas phyllosphaerae]